MRISSFSTRIVRPAVLVAALLSPVAVRSQVRSSNAGEAPAATPGVFDECRQGYLVAPGLGYDSLVSMDPLVGDAAHAVRKASYVEPAVLPSEEFAADDVAERLKAAEARIRELEQAQAADDRSESRTAATLSMLKERWDKARDPSITTVDQQTKKSSEKKSADKKWYDRLSIRGYTQLRWNEILNTSPGSATPHFTNDRSIGEDQSFLIRRARIILSGDVSDRMYVYIQPDFAVTPSGSTDAIHFASLRDWYADVYLDDDKVHRLRIGLSKVPYGWESLQSSSNRLALERSDAINSAVRNERDLGVFYYWTPEPAQQFFKDVLDQGLKGSGNYGVLGIGIYNGQGGSLAEQNDDIHGIARLTLPYRFDGGQCLEAGIQGYIGRYTVLSSPIRPLGVGGSTRPLNALETGGQRGVLDERLAGTVVWYPQPIGFQAEWNVGRGPGLNDTQTAIVERALYGGYLQTMAKIDTRNWGTVFPYLRWVYFQGGYRSERNAPFSQVDEWELGTEWQINPQMELTTAYLLTDRTNTTAFDVAGVRSYQQFNGSVLRFQFQFNF